MTRVISHTDTHMNESSHTPIHRATHDTHLEGGMSHVSRIIHNWKGRRGENQAEFTHVSCHTHITLQHAATRCNTLQHTATHCNTNSHTEFMHVSCHAHITLQHAATRCNTLQHAATHCNTLQHTATRIHTRPVSRTT